MKYEETLANYKELTNTYIDEGLTNYYEEKLYINCIEFTSSIYDDDVQSQTKGFLLIIEKSFCLKMCCNQMKQLSEHIAVQC